jgi:hypothetical protein
MLVKKLASYSVLISICLSLANVGVIASMCFSKKFAFKRTICPLHANHCCCPEVCKDFQKQVADKECHRSTDSTPNSKTRSDSSSSVCFLKAGCGERDLLASSGLFQKDFLPQSRVISLAALDVSFLSDGLHFCVLPDYSSRFFHPPRNS